MIPCISIFADFLHGFHVPSLVVINYKMPKYILFKYKTSKRIDSVRCTDLQMVCPDNVYSGHTATTTRVFYIVGISIIGFLCIISITIAGITIKQLVWNNTNTINKLYKCLTISCILIMTLCCAGDLTHLVVRFMDFPYCNGFDTSEGIVMGCIDSVYYSGNIIFYVLLLLRIYNTFHISKSVTFILVLFIIITTLTSASFVIIVIHFADNVKQFYFYNKYITLALSSADLILNISFFVIFWQQLKKTASDIDIQSNMYQNLANVLTKHIVLFGIAIITNQLFFIWVMAFTWYDTKYTLFAVIIAYGVRSFEIFINVIILWLVLNINYGRYIHCCRCPHVFIAQCCVQNNEMPLQNPYRELESKSMGGTSAKSAM